MEKERFLLDLDGTIWEQDFEEENKYFKSVLSNDDYLNFIKVKGSLFSKYESIYHRHNVLWLSEFFKQETGINFTEKLLDDWLDFNSNSDTVLFEGAIELLEDLKSKNKSLVVRSNKFRKEQYGKLKKAGILDYFDEIYGGDSYLKPHAESYIEAAGNYPISKCVMIGDSLEKDVLAPRRIGMDSIYYNPSPEDEKIKIDKTVKSLIKIKDIYD